MPLSGLGREDINKHFSCFFSGVGVGSKFLNGSTSSTNPSEY